MKNPADENATIKDAWEQINIRYWRDIPHLLHYCPLACISDGVKTRLGTVRTPYEHFYAWRRVNDGDKVSTSPFDEMRTMVKGVYEPERFLEIFRDYIYFQDKEFDDKEKEIVCRYPQFFATRLLRESIVKSVKEKSGKGGTYFGATGCGKTYTMANIIKNLNCKTLVMAHNKTLAAQLYSEFKEMFPNNKVEYFVSAFDFYQPEAFLPKTNTYIEKNSQTNSDIEMLNISALNSLTDRDDVIVVASVACIYASTPPVEFMKNKLHLVLNQKINIKDLQYALVNLNYQRNDVDVIHGKFSIKGDVVEIAPGFTDEFNIRLSFFGDEVEEIAIIEPLSKNVIRKEKEITICAADLYLANKDTLEESLSRIERELQLVHQNFKDNNKLIEAQRI